MSSRRLHEPELTLQRLNLIPQIGLGHAHLLEVADGCFQRAAPRGEQLLLSGQMDLRVPTAFQPAGQVSLNFVASVRMAGEDEVDLLALKRGTEPADLGLLVGQCLPTTTSVGLQCLDLDLFLGHQADVGVHLGDQVLDHVLGAAQLPLDGNRVRHGGLDALAAGANITAQVAAEQQPADAGHDHHYHQDSNGPLDESHGELLLSSERAPWRTGSRPTRPWEPDRFALLIQVCIVPGARNIQPAC